MTSVISDRGATSTPGDEPEGEPDIVIVPDPEPEPTATPNFTRRRIWVLVGVWATVMVACFGLVVYGLEPLFVSQKQGRLLADYRGAIERSANEVQGLPGVSTPTKATEFGEPVAIVEIGTIHLQQAVVEGVAAGQTADGPGHVPGTAAPGQPGNCVVIGRRTAYGGPFHGLDVLGPGDAILVTTTQGQVVYNVSSVDEVVIDQPTSTTGSAASATSTSAAVGVAHVQVDDLYGPTTDDRLTLVTSDSLVPWNSSRATVVVATMDGSPFPPTPQNGRIDSATGVVGSATAWAPLALALMGLVVAAVSAAWLYRRTTFTVAYLLTTPPLILFTILMAETFSHLLPPWM